MKIPIGTTNILLSAVIAAVLTVALLVQRREIRSLHSELSGVEDQLSHRSQGHVNGDLTLPSDRLLMWEDAPGVVGIRLARASDGMLQMNREIRMEGSGTGALFGVKNTDSNANGFATDVPGDKLNRFTIAVSGKMWWGDGTNGQDLELFRAGPHAMQLDGSFALADTLTLYGGAPQIINPSGPITISPSGWDVIMGGYLRVNNPYKTGGWATATGTVDLKDVNGHVVHVLVHE